MVQKSKGGKKSKSVIAVKRQKASMKTHRKTNFKKKKKEKQIECSVCYEMIPDNSDNVISCGKKVHPLCGSCKIKIGTDSCPMCRSHKIPPLKSQVHQIRIMKSKMSEPPLPNRLQIKGAGYPFLNGIYSETEITRVYLNEEGIYLYRGNTGQWELNDDYHQGALIYGDTSGKLFGKHAWFIGRSSKQIIITITVVK